MRARLARPWSHHRHRGASSHSALHAADRARQDLIAPHPATHLTRVLLNRRPMRTATPLQARKARTPRAPLPPRPRTSLTTSSTNRTPLTKVAPAPTKKLTTEPLQVTLPARSQAPSRWPRPARRGRGPTLTTAPSWALYSPGTAGPPHKRVPGARKTTREDPTAPQIGATAPSLPWDTRPSWATVPAKAPRAAPSERDHTAKACGTRSGA